MSFPHRARGIERRHSEGALLIHLPHVLSLKTTRDRGPVQTLTTGRGRLSPDPVGGGETPIRRLLSPPLRTMTRKAPENVMDIETRIKKKKT